MTHSPTTATLDAPAGVVRLASGATASVPCAYLALYLLDLADEGLRDAGDRDPELVAEAASLGLVLEHPLQATAWAYMETRGLALCACCVRGDTTTCNGCVDGVATNNEGTP